MDRRTTAGTLFATVFAGGIAAMIAVPSLPEASPYFSVLMYGGAAAVVIGLAGLLFLFFFPKKPERRRPVSDDENAPREWPRSAGLAMTGKRGIAYGNTIVGTADVGIIDSGENNISAMNRIDINRESKRATKDGGKRSRKYFGGWSPPEKEGE